MISVDELRRIPLFAALPAAEAQALAERMADIRLRTGEWLLHEGEQPSFFLLVEGSLELRKVVHGVDRRLDEYRAGTYFGELPLLLGSPAIASLRAQEPSRIARLAQEDFTTLFSSCSTFAAELTRTMTERFTRLQRLAAQAPPPTVTIVGHRFDVACHHLRDFLARNRVVYRWVDPTRADVLGEFVPPQPGDRFPLVVLPDGTRLQTPTLRELARGLALATEPKLAEYDVAIVGAGPAGLAAAVYGSAPATRPSGSAPSSSPAGPSPRWNPVATVSRTSCAPTVVTSARGRWSSPPVWPTESWACRRSRTSSASGSSTAARCRRPGRWRAPTSSSWVGGTPPDRRPSTSPGSRGR